MPSPPDARLVAPAVATWLAALVVLVARPEAQWWWIAAVVLAALVAGAAMLAAVRLRAQVGLLLAIGVVAFTAAGAAAGALSAAVHLQAMSAAPLPSWTSSRAPVEVEGVISDEPLVRTSRHAAVWQDHSVRVVHLSTTRMASGGSVIDIEVPLVLRLPAVTGNVPPPGALVQAKGRLVVSGSVDAAAVLVVESLKARAAAGPIDAAAHAMRIGLRRAVGRVPPDAGALVAGLAVGDTSLMPALLAADMRRTGLSHLTAVSGGNVAIVLGLVIGLAVGLRLPLWSRVVAGLAALAAFTVLVGPQPSVLRSVAMGAVTVLALLSGGRRAGPSVLSAAVIVLVILVPTLAVSWGFALSVAATAGLVLLATPVRKWAQHHAVTRRWPPRIRDAIVLTLAAQVATLPVMALMGAFAGWTAVPANLLAEPLVAPVTVVGLLTACLAPWWPWGAQVLAQLAAVPASGIAFVAHACPALPFARVGWPTGVAGLGLLAVLIGCAVVVRGLWRRGARAGALGVAALAAAAVIIASTGRRAWPPPGWFVIACDVGQGDALLLRSGPASAVLVDAGPDPDAVDSCLDRAGIRDLPAIVLTHFHADHVGGLPGALHGRSVGVVLVSPVREPAGDAAQVDAWTQGRTVQSVSAGDTRVVGDVSWRALWPQRRIDAGSVPNNASIVLDAIVDGHRVLLSGDVEREAQAALLPLLHGVDVVKVPHHGSRNMDPQLPVRAPAAIALVSVGADNPYGHPSADALAAWRSIGALVERTDLDGDIAVVAAPTGLGVVRRG